MAVRLEWSDRVGTIVIDRPEKRNAVDLETLQAIVEGQHEVARRECRVLVVRGVPPAFCSGADLDGAELGEFTDVLTGALKGFALWDGLTVAYIDGPALGAGMQIAAACDVRIASPTSVVGIPAAKLGLAVDTWTVARLVRELGWSRARTVLLTGDPVGCQSLVPGFISRITQAPSGEESLAEAMDIIGEWALRAPLTVRAHKTALEYVSGDGTPFDDVEAARLTAWNSTDAIEGRAAFRERRPPDFRGR